VNAIQNAIRVLDQMDERLSAHGYLDNDDPRTEIKSAIRALRLLDGEVVMVPKEPSEDQRIAGFECEAMDQLSDFVLENPGKWPYGCKEAAEFVTAIYTAMITEAQQGSQD